MMYHKLAGLLACVSLFVLVGCKVDVLVPEGGRVYTESGGYECLANATCTIDIEDTTFRESFVAEPAAGFLFAGWKKEPGYFCGNSLDPCTVDSSILAIFEGIEALLASDVVFYLEPMFEPVMELQLTLVADNIDTVDASGQPDFIYVASVLDLNGDGFDDLVAAGPKWRDGFVDETVPLQALLNDGNNNFSEGIADILAAGADLPALVHSREGAVADFNGDGLDDLAIAAHGFDGGNFPGERNLLLLSGPDGKYTDAGLDDPAFDYLGFTHSLAVADIDLDGDVDIVFTDLFGPDGTCETVRVLENQGAGNFVAHTDRLPVAYTEGYCGFWTTTELADLNGDGYPDLVAGGGNSDAQTVVFWNNGSGQFTGEGIGQPKVLTTAAGYPILTDIQTLDIDGNGRLDLLIASTGEDPFYSGRYIQVLMNTGGNNFKDETGRYLPDQQLDGNWVMGMELVDINGDHREDMVLSFDVPPGSGTDYLLLRQVDNSFQWADSASIPQEAVGSPTAIDADKDGDNDLLVYQSSLISPSGLLEGNLLRNGD